MRKTQKWPLILAWLGFIIELFGMTINLFALIANNSEPSGSSFFNLTIFKPIYFSILAIGFFIALISVIINHFSKRRSSELKIIFLSTLIGLLLSIFLQIIYEIGQVNDLFDTVVGGIVGSITDFTPLIFIAASAIAITLFILITSLKLHHRRNPRTNH